MKERERREERERKGNIASKGGTSKPLKFPRDACPMWGPSWFQICNKILNFKIGEFLNPMWGPSEGIARSRTSLASTSHFKEVKHCISPSVTSPLLYLPYSSYPRAFLKAYHLLGSALPPHRHQAPKIL